MAYKRNPMRSERIAALSRYIIADSLNPAMTAATQWFERTLDDSANKRISVAEAFLAADAVLSLVINVVDGLVGQYRRYRPGSAAGAALHGDREHHDGLCQTGGGPAGAP